MRTPGTSSKWVPFVDLCVHSLSTTIFQMSLNKHTLIVFVVVYEAALLKVLFCSFLFPPNPVSIFVFSSNFHLWSLADMLRMWAGPPNLSNLSKLNTDEDQALLMGHPWSMVISVWNSLGFFPLWIWDDPCMVFLLAEFSMLVVWWKM